MKTFLLKYELPMFQSLNSGGTTYKLTVKTVRFFGLVTNIKTMDYIIPDYESIKAYTDHWNRLILEKPPLLITDKAQNDEQ